MGFLHVRPGCRGQKEGGGGGILLRMSGFSFRYRVSVSPQITRGLSGIIRQVMTFGDDAAMGGSMDYPDQVRRVWNTRPTRTEYGHMKTVPTCRLGYPDTFV